MTYAVTEVFRTLQGEGSRSGTAAVFLRFAGCNLWSGQEQHRRRDAERNGACCPEFCDTDFAPRERLDLDSLLARVSEVGLAPMLVMTGGEPLLQLDVQLLSALRESFQVLAVETNGTVALEPGVAELLDHVCVSPKVEPSKLLVRSGTELKVVWPAYDPLTYESLLGGFQYAWVSPEARPTAVGRSLVEQDNVRGAAEFCMRNPRWRLSLQAHKYAGLP